MSSHFFDVGSNKGQTFDDFLCPTSEFDGWTIWCFEPSPRHLTKLIERATKERDRYKIMICPFGIWTASAVIKLWEKDDSLGDSFEESLAHTHNLKNDYEIHAAVVSLCGFMDDVMTGPDRAVVKIDAEGAEYAILNDLIQDHHKHVRDRIDRLIVEWHHCSSTFKYPSQEDTEKAFLGAGLPIEKWQF